MWNGQAVHTVGMENIRSRDSNGVTYQVIQKCVSLRPQGLQGLRMRKQVDCVGEKKERARMVGC